MHVCAVYVDHWGQGTLLHTTHRVLEFGADPPAGCIPWQSVTLGSFTRSSCTVGVAILGEEEEGGTWGTHHFLQNPHHTRASLFQLGRGGREGAG